MSTDLVNKLRMLAEDVHSQSGHNLYSSTMSTAADRIQDLEREERMTNEELTIDDADSCAADTFYRAAIAEADALVAASAYHDAAAISYRAACRRARDAHANAHTADAAYHAAAAAYRAAAYRVACAATALRARGEV